MCVERIKLLLWDIKYGRREDCQENRGLERDWSGGLDARVAPRTSAGAGRSELRRLVIL